MSTPRWSPWILKQLPSGIWVIDQLDRLTNRVRRFGTYESKAEAREIFEDLTAGRRGA